MNVYRVYVDTEKVSQGWTVGAGSAVSAIGKAMRNMKATQAKDVQVTCKMIAKNTDYKVWKASQGTQP